MAAKKAAPKKSGASDKAKKAESARMTKAAAARKASGQTYIDKRGTFLGFTRGDTAGYLATTPQSSKNLPMGGGKGQNPVKYGGYGKTARRQLDQDKRKDAKKAANAKKVAKGKK
jgi:uncharacterized Rossmann fold enzyme